MDSHKKLSDNFPFNSRGYAKKYKSYDLSDHDEIVITKSDWESICSKIHKLDIKNSVDILSILVGVVLTTLFNYFLELLQDKQAHIQPVIISGIFVVLYLCISRLSSYIFFTMIITWLIACISKIWKN